MGSEKRLRLKERIILCVKAHNITVTPSAIRISHGITKNNTPSVVDRPFPPRNPRKTGQIWPATAANPAARTKQVTMLKSESIGELFNREAIKTAAAPLAISKSAVAIPTVFPIFLKVFLAPTLPPLTLRTSLPEVKRVNM